MISKEILLAHFNYKSWGANVEKFRFMNHILIQK